MVRWLAVRGAKCDHGSSVPAQGISRAGRPWYGLFCPASMCRPSWRHPNDPWVADTRQVSDDEARYRMHRAALAFSEWIKPGVEQGQGDLW